MEENGMDKLASVVHGMLFMMEHNEVDPEQACFSLSSIRDFETGEYDDLLTPGDLLALKADIRTVKEYVEKHPELLDCDGAEELREWFFGKS